ncbi:MAG: hypothetical protein CMB80_08170, partial [Flammeovirgaceae bacterium]|nr:hypothetical protein [Flammeovirgaceae bacterium]
DTLSAPGNGSSTDGIHINFGSKARILNNYIGSAGQWGIRIYFDSDDTKIQGNVIGTGLTGTEDFGCGYGGITAVYRPSFSVIGGNLPGQENIIAYNNGPAIDFDLPTSGTSATESFFVLNNSIYENNEGIVANSPSTSGAVLNKGILPPVIQTFNASTIAGTLQGNLGGYTGEVQLHLYESDGSLSPQGKVLLDSANVIGDTWSFSGSFDENKVYLATVSVDTMGTSLYAQVISNFAVALDGTNDYVDLGSGFATAMAGQESSFTAEWWIKMETDATSTQDGMLAVNTSTGGNALLILYKNNSGSRIFTIYDGVSAADEIIYNGVILGEWYHVAYSSDGSTGSLYVNGELVGTHVPDYTFTATDLWSIGMEYDSGPSPGDYADATFDEFRIWNVARSAFEIKSAYRNKVANDAPGLFTYYPMSEGPGFSVLGDSTGNGFDGNLINVDNSSIWIQGAALEKPQPYIKTVYPSNNGIDIALDSTFSLVFNTSVQAGSGFVHAIDQSDSSVIESINVALMDGMPSDSVWFSFNNLVTGGTYSITIDSGAYVLDDVAYPGLIDTAFWSFTMVDSPPVAPSDLTSIDHGDGTFTLAWLDNAEDETDYKIQKSYDKITWLDETVGLGVDQTTYTTAIQALDTGYWWRAVVIGIGGEAPSNEVFSDTYTYEKSAIVLDGTDDYVSVGNIYDFTTGSFTLEAWARRDAINETGWVMSVGTTPSSNSYLHFGFAADNTLKVDLYAGDNVNSTATVTDNFWHHIAVSYNNSSGATRLYLDGTDVTPADSVMTTFAGTNDFRIGQAFNTEFFEGAVDEVKVWSGVKLDFSDRFAPIPGDTSGLVLYYKLNEGQDLETFDQTGSLNTGLFNGTMDNSDWISSGAYDTPPVIVSRIPVIGDTDIIINTPIQATFDQNIAIGSGNIEIWRKLDSTLVETFDVTSDVIVSGNTLEFTPSLLQVATEYSVIIPENAVMSLTGKTLTAIVALSAWTFTTQAQTGIIIDNPVQDDIIDEGTLQDVEFTNFGYSTTDSIEISVSYDGGVTYNLLLKDSTISQLTTNNYIWNTDSPDSTGAWLKIENVTSAPSGSYKDSVHVTIVPYLYFPYEFYDKVVGDYINVEWNSNSNVSTSDLVEISFSSDGGLTYTVIETGNPMSFYGTGSYYFDFLADGPLTSNAQVKVENLTNPYVLESELFVVDRPSLTIDYVYDAYSCGSADGEMEVFGLGYGATYNIFYTQDGVELSSTIDNTEVAYLSGLSKGEYTNIYVEYNGIYSDTVAGPIYIDDGSPRTYLTGTDNLNCGTPNGVIDVVDSVAFSADFELYLGTDTTVSALDIQSDLGAWTFSGLAGGTYSVVTRYVGGGTCVDLKTITIFDTPDRPVIDSALTTYTNPTTVGGVDGRIILLSEAVSGGSGEFTKQWYLGADTTTAMVGETGDTLAGLAQGAYTLLVSDGGGTGCSSELFTFFLNDPAVLSAIALNSTTSTTAQLQLDNTQIANISYVITNSNVTPSATRISAGLDENGNPAYSANTLIDAPSGTVVFDVGTDVALLPATEYFIYFVADNGNFSNIISTSFFTLANAIPYPGYAVQFDGVNDEILFTNFIQQDWTDFTIEMWAKVPSTTSGQMNLFEQTDANGGAQPQTIIAAILDGDPYFFVRETNSGGDGGFVTSSIPVNDDAWHHLAYVRSGTTYMIYVDGILAASGTGTANGLTFPTVNVQTLLAGDAALDELKFWSVAKSDFSDRVTPLVGNEANLLGYYSFDAGGGIVAADSSLSANDGVLTNFDFVTGSEWILSEIPEDVTPPLVTVDTLFTNETSPALTGTIDDSDAGVEVTVDGNTYTATNNGSTWSIAAGTITTLSDGIYDVLVTATDSLGNIGTDSTTNELGIDATAPAVTIEYLASNDISPELTGSVDDPSALIDVTVDGATYAATNNGDGSWVLAQGTIADLIEGSYTTQAVATDSVGNADTATATLDIELTAPAITINYLASNDISPELTGSVDDPSALIDVTVDGATYAATNNGDGSWTLAQGTIADLVEGSYTTQAVATDSVGNADTATATLDIELTAPIVTIDYLSSNDVSPELTGSVDDPSALIDVTVDGTTYAATNNGDGSWVLAQGTIADLIEGSYTTQAVAIDSVGNADTATATLDIELTAPIVTIDYLASNDISPELTGSVDDPSASIDVTVDGATYAATNNGDGSWVLAQGTIADLIEGSYSTQAVATDSVGNADTAFSTIDIELTAPVVTINDLVSNQTSPELTGTVDDPTASIDVAVDGSSYTALNNGDGSWVLAQSTIADLIDGTYTIHATATDSVGNSSIASGNLVIALINPGTALDSAALLTLYDSLGGATWTSTNWKSGANL